MPAKMVMSTKKTVTIGKSVMAINGAIRLVKINLRHPRTKRIRQRIGQMKLRKTGKKRNLIVLNRPPTEIKARNLILSVTNNNSTGITTPANGVISGAKIITITRGAAVVAVEPGVVEVEGSRIKLRAACYFYKNH